MSRCGVCGGGISLTVIPHAELCEDDVKALSRQMCGGCLVPLDQCHHAESVRPHKKDTGQRSKRRVVYS